jgi:hypothetical protein
MSIKSHGPLGRVAKNSFYMTIFGVFFMAKSL